MLLSLSRNAENDIDSATGWYNSQRKGLGAEFLSAVERLLTKIHTQPLLYAAFQHSSNRNLRYAVVRRFPYRIVFEIKEKHIIVLAIAHTSRKPDYWL